MALDLQSIKREFLAGGVAGAIGILIGFPLDLIKAQMQSNPAKYPTALSALSSTLKEGGPGALFRGCVPPVLMQGLINSLMFTGESIAIKVLEPNRKPGEPGSMVNSFLAGSCGGLLQCTVLVPSEVIKCAMQTGIISQSGSTKPMGAFAQTMFTVKHVYRTEGFMGFYKGLGATAVRDIPSIGIYFFVYKNSRELFAKIENSRAPQGAEKAKPSNLATIMAGGAAGTVSWAIIYPLDVIKTITQISTVPVAGNAKAYKDMQSWQVGLSLFRQHGIGVFYRGLGPTLVRAFPVNAATFFFYEQFKSMMEFPL